MGLLAGHGTQPGRLVRCGAGPGGLQSCVWGGEVMIPALDLGSLGKRALQGQALQM